jgi:hypothetical protein
MANDHGGGRPSRKVRHDIRDEKFTALGVVPIAIDQQVDAGVLVLPDQVDGLRHGAGEAARIPAIGNCSRLAATVASFRARSQARIWVFSIVS